MQPSEVYSAPQRLIHWLMALSILSMLPVGFYMANAFGADFPPERGQLYELHKSFGFIVFLLACARVFFRLTRGAPEAEASLSLFQRRVSRVVHYLLYVLIFVVPLSGWIATSMCCAPVNLFWTVPVTLPVSGGEELYKRVFAVHMASAILMTVLVLAHIGAAIMHLVVMKDGVFRRMWPSRAA